MKQKVICLFSIAAIVLCFFFMPMVNAETLQEQKAENEKKQEEAQEKLEYVQIELSESLLEIQELDDKIRTAEAEIKEMNEKLLDIQKDIKETQERLETVEERYQKNKDLMEKRLIVMYECGNITYLEMLLHSSSLVDFLSNCYVIEEMVKSDNDLLDLIEKEKNEIEASKKKLEERKAELKLIRVKSEQTRIIMQNNKVIQQNAIERLSEEEIKLQEKIQEYKDEQERIENLIKYAASNYIYTGDYEGGVMAWPIAKTGTYITSPFGMRRHPIQGIIKGHTGIDIGNAGFGAPVIAAADGVVSMASYYGGYGNCVMINHGNGIATLYGHGQKILTEVGTEVKKGDLIMEVGSTGASTGPHLHFEVRVNGTPVSPLPFLGLNATEEDSTGEDENETQTNKVVNVEETSEVD